MVVLYYAVVIDTVLTNSYLLVISILHWLMAIECVIDSGKTAVTFSQSSLAAFASLPVKNSLYWLPFDNTKSCGFLIQIF